MKHQLSLLIGLSLTIWAAAQEWSRFRGPNGSGLAAPAPNIPVKFSESDFNWKIDLPGTGHSCPSIWGDHLFIPSSDPASARRTLLCINTRDGSEFWHKDFDSHT